jgi:hypothetical protein
MAGQVHSAVLVEDLESRAALPFQLEEATVLAIPVEAADFAKIETCYVKQCEQGIPKQ